jgi:hypothetical protein
MSSTAAIPTNQELVVKNPSPAEFLWHVHGNLSEQIKFADQKAGFVAVLATGVMGGLHSVRVHEHFTNGPMSTWGWSGWAGLAAFGLLAGSLVACFVSIAPRRRYTSPRGFIFWGAIAAYDTGDEFNQELLAATPDSLTEHLSHQTYALARICKEKYGWLNWAIGLVVAGSELGGVLLLWASIAGPS